MSTHTYSITNCEKPVDQIKWRKERDDSRTCPLCGSLHPEDFIDIMWRFSQREAGYHFSMTTKGHYKYYGNRPNVGNAGDGGIKFYGVHLRDEFSTEFEAARQLALLEYQRRLEEQFPALKERR